jgi:hypothetical protein
MSTERAVSGSSMWPGPLPPMPPFARRTAGEDWYSGRRVPVLLWPGHLPACPADTAHRNDATVCGKIVAAAKRNSTPGFGRDPQLWIVLAASRVQERSNEVPRPHQLLFGHTTC